MSEEVNEVVSQFQSIIQSICEAYTIFDPVIVAVFSMSPDELVSEIKSNYCSEAANSIHEKIIDAISYYSIDIDDAEDALKLFDKVIDSLNLEKRDIKLQK